MVTIGKCPYPTIAWVNQEPRVGPSGCDREIDDGGPARQYKSCRSYGGDQAWLSPLGGLSCSRREGDSTPQDTTGDLCGIGASLPRGSGADSVMPGVIGSSRLCRTQWGRGTCPSLFRSCRGGLRTRTRGPSQTLVNGHLVATGNKSPLQPMASQRAYTAFPGTRGRSR